MSVQEKYALSDAGVRNVRFGILWTVITNLVAVGGLALMYFTMNDLLAVVVESAPFPPLAPYAIGLVVFAVAFWVCNKYQYYYTYGVVYRESKQQRINLGERLRKLPLSFFGRRDVADLTETLLTDTSTIEHVASHVVPELYGALISAGCFAAMMLIFNWQMTFAAMWSVPFAFALIFLSARVLRDRLRCQRAQAVAVSNEIQDTLETMREIRATNQEQTFLLRLYNKIENHEKQSIANECICGVFAQSGAIVLRLGLATTLLVGALLVVRDSMDFMMMFAFLLAVSRVYAPFDQALALLFEMFASHTSAERLNALAREPLMEGSLEYHPQGHTIEFRDVTFSYDAQASENAQAGEDAGEGAGAHAHTGENVQAPAKAAPVLSRVSFSAREGQVTALVGPSGSGKSTCSKLAARFWDVDAGSITVGGVDIAHIDPETLLKDYAIVFQEVLLFDGSVLDNIRLGCRDATDEEVLAAARAANCDEFAHKLPQGYDTSIGENGSKLSGGERQRISIARALLKDAPIVLLDEATASLDVENETQVQSALARLLAGKTVLVIAHRMRTVMGADKIVVLKDGAVVEQGTPAELMQKPDGVFYRMVALQTQSTTWAV